MERQPELLAQTVGISSSPRASVALDRLLKAFQASTNPDELSALAGALEALAPKLTPEQARAALDPLFGTFQASTDPDELSALAGALGALPVQLTPEQARAVFDPLLSAFQVSTDPFKRGQLGGALGVLASGLTPEQARAALDPLLSAFQTSTDPLERGRPGGALGVLAPKLTPEQAQRVLKVAQTKLAKAESQNQAQPPAELIGSLLQLRSPDEHITEVVEILKYPTAAGQPTEILLEGLRKRFSDAPSGSLLETAAWAEQRFPHLRPNLSSPPVRPDAPAREG